MLLAAPAQAAPPPLRLATYAYPRYDRAAALAPLAALIKRVAGREVEVVLLETPDALRDAVLAGKADLAVPNLAAWLGMRANPAATAIARLDVPAATLNRYRGVLVARRGAGVESVQGLKGQERKLRYAEVLPGSTSGALVQADMLRRLGVERSRFEALLSSGTHEAALADLLAGRADLAALAEEPWRQLRDSDPAAASRLIELWRSEPLPSAPIVCVHSAATACDKIGAALLEAGSESAAAARGLAAGWSELEGASAFAPPQA